MTSRTLTAVAAGAFVLSAAGAAVAQTPYSAYQTRDLGYGSIESSCRNIQQAAGGYISAECATEGGYRWSTIRQSDCRGDLSNRDGVLACYGATARVGPFYPAEVATGSAYETSGPTGVIGALFGAIFGDAFGSDQSMDQDFGEGRRPLGERREALTARIDAGVRDGSLTRREADRLRDDYDDLVRLETRYYADGRLTTAERDDLRSRYRNLQRRVGEERRDDQGYDNGWRGPVEGRASVEARIEAGVRDGSLTRREALQLRSDYAELIRLEARYSADGLSRQERNALQDRYNSLSRRIGDERTDGQGNDNDWRWTPLAQRAMAFDSRIDAAVRSRQITRYEGLRLRTEFTRLQRLEDTYGRDGLSATEQSDLRTRYDALSMRIGDGYRDDYGSGPDYPGGYGDRPTGPAVDIEAAIISGERSGAIDRDEAARLRTELGDLVRLEAAYASDGLNAAERDYVYRRFAELDLRVRAARR